MHDTALLTSECVQLHWVIHPAIAEHLSASTRGVTTSPAPDTVGASGDVVTSEVTVALSELASLSTLFPFVEPRGPVVADASPQLLAAGRRRLKLKGISTLPVRRSTLAVRIRGTKATLTPWDPFEIPDVPISVSSARHLLEKARLRNIPVIDAHQASMLFRQADRTLVATPTPNAPGWVTLTGTHNGIYDPLDTMVLAGEQNHQIALHPHVVEAADVSLAGPAGRPRLYPWQDHAVSALLAASRGLVLALPPGSGKTVVSACALSEVLGKGSTAVVFAPGSVLTQWSSTLASFAPELEVLTIRSHEELTKVTTDTTRSRVLVTTHDMATEVDESSLSLSLIIVDEAQVVTTESQRARALWRIRERAERAWALTGTPEERGESRVARLCSWALHDTVTADPDRSVLDRVGPFLFAGNVPAPCKVTARSVPITATPMMASELESIVASEFTSFTARVAFEKLRRLAASGKIAWLLDSTSTSEPTLVFCDNLELADQVLHLLLARNIKAASLAGVSAMSRTMTAAAFTKGDVDVLICSSSSQRGVDLQRASRVISLDLPSSSGVLSQRAARAVRIGGPAEVTILLPYLEGTVEELLVSAMEPALADLTAGRSPQVVVIDDLAIFRSTVT